MVDFYFLGLLDIEESLVIQEKILELCSQNSLPPTVLFLEHPEVITCGRNSCEKSVSLLKKQGLRVVQTDRGGELTAHMPGQLIVYPILPMRVMGLSVKKYVHLMEQVVIDLLQTYGINGTRRLSYPGVWSGMQKISSIGIRVKKRVTKHGLAVNISNNLDLFSQFTPCGIKGCEVSSLEAITGNTISLGEISHKFIDHFVRIFQTNVGEIRACDDWRQIVKSQTKKTNQIRLNGVS